jgi:hypothetical protein
LFIANHLIDKFKTIAFTVKDDVLCPGMELVRRFTSLAMNETPDFKLGSDRSMIIFGYITGRLKNEEQYEEISAAQRIARTADRNQIGAILMMTLFINEVEKRFSE